MNQVRRQELAILAQKKREEQIKLETILRRNLRAEMREEKRLYEV